jgi:AbiV family abortive infection protein
MPPDLIAMFDFLRKSSIKQNKALTKEQVATLLHFCYCNAKDLYEEADLLRKNKKYARAFFLCTLALEELAKIPLGLNALFLPPDDLKAWRGFWRDFNSHKSKLGSARIYGQGLLKILSPKNWSSFYKKTIPKGLPLHELKLASMYVDCYDGVAARPNKIFTQEEGSVSSIFEIVKDRLAAWEEIHSTIDKSIRFVKASLKIPIKIDGQNLKDALVAGYKKRSKRVRTPPGA